MPLFYSPGVVRVGTNVQLETVTDSFVVGAAATGGTFTPLTNELRVAGNGASGFITFYTNSAERWRINASGHLVPGGDNTLDIGASASEIRSIYINGTGGASAINFNNATTSLTENSGFIVCNGGFLANNGALGFRDGGGGFTLTVSSTVVDLNANSSGNTVKVTGQLAAATAGTSADATLRSGATRTAGWIARMDNNTTRKWGLKFDARMFYGVPNSAPTDGDLQASEVTWYLNEGANNLLARVKYADGTTLKLGTVALV